MIMFALSSAVLIGMCGLVVDFSRVLYARSVLQGSSDAAATAGAADMTGTSTVPTSATLFSSLAGKKNARTNLTGVTMAAGFPQLKCLTSSGLPPCPSSVTYNAISVRQQVTVPMYFATVLGFSNMVVTATSTAGMRGGVMPPLDIALVVDTTGSMSGACGSGTRLDCAKDGIRTLLGVLWPCAQNLATCGAVTSGNVSNPIDKVGMFIFPGLKTTAAVAQEYDCSANVTSSGNYSTWEIAKYDDSPNYLIVPLSSDYRTSTTSALNGSSSNLVKTVDWAHGNTCGANSYGLENPGGVGSYFSDAITKAQQTLVSSGRANVQNVIIFVSDGDSDQYAGGPANPCQLAINAADAAATAGTWVYAIAYGSTTASSSCPDDASLSSKQTMQGIASSTSKFFDVPSANELTSTFQKIGVDLTNTRILSDDTP